VFRSKDTEAMSSSFDLSSYQDVRTNAEKIYERLSDGSMPCDHAWPADQVRGFHAWMDSGHPR
jgi:hypothetical protein